MNDPTREDLEKLGPVVETDDATVVVIGHMPGMERVVAELGRAPTEAEIAKAEEDLTRGDGHALTSANVQRIAERCTRRKFESRNGVIEVEGIKHVFAFHPSRIDAHRAEISAMLAELPHQFRASGGGGWTFLNACARHPYTDDGPGRGEMWTGLHLLVETLIALGIAAGKARWLMPREYWSMMPGGMPYVVVDP